MKHAQDYQPVKHQGFPQVPSSPASDMVPQIPKQEEEP